MPTHTDDSTTPDDDTSGKTGVTPGAGHRSLHHIHTSGLGRGQAEATGQVEQSGVGQSIQTQYCRVYHGQVHCWRQEMLSY